MKILILIIWSVAWLGLPGRLMAQSQGSVRIESNIVGGDSITLRLIKDFSGRTAQIKDVKVSWELTPYGYRGIYTVSNLEYITWYNLSGNYMETMLKTAWDDRVPAILKMELDHSDFNRCLVLTYWVKINTDREDYYLVVEDTDGSTKYIWSDDNGNFSLVPVFKR